jgi:hypothetical protein
MINRLGDSQYYSLLESQPWIRQIFAQDNPAAQQAAQNVITSFERLGAVGTPWRILIGAQQPGKMVGKRWEKGGKMVGELGETWWKNMAILWMEHLDFSNKNMDVSGIKMG